MPKYAIISNGEVTDIIIADEEFIASQGLNAILSDHASVGSKVDSQGNVLYPIVSNEPLIEPNPPLDPTPTP